MTKAKIVDFAELGEGDARTFRGADHGGMPVSFILDREKPGSGPALHRHPYDEVWILDEGEVTFTAGDETLTAGPGSIVVVPAGTPHQFKNTGTKPVRMVCIHPRAQMETEWLAQRDRTDPGGPTR
jgi:mannose-6-phosphate isomerase-like protein (cupin superfamily)